MKYKILMALFAAIVSFGLCGSAFAKTHTHPSGGITFDAPDDWDVAEEADALVVATPQEGVFILFWAVKPDQVEQGVEILVTKLEEVAQDLEVDGEPKERDLNGIQALTVVGKGKVDTGEGDPTPIVWTGAILLANEDKPVIMAAVVDGSQWEAYKGPITDLLKSIRPVGAEGGKAAEPEAGGKPPEAGGKKAPKEGKTAAPKEGRKAAPKEGGGRAPAPSEGGE